MKTACLAFTEKGFLLASQLAQALGGTAERSDRSNPVHQWTKLHFYREQALIYVGAVGIAVRAVAPYLKSKTTDPAVVVVDECARFAIPVLSGHLGGANELARRVGALCGAVPVITTATDINGVFAVDTWARSQQCVVEHTQCIRKISGALLAGKNIHFHSDVPIAGDPPPGMVAAFGIPADLYVGYVPPPESVLWVVPRMVVLGVGCRKGTSAQAIENVFRQIALPLQAVCAVATIDRKAEEPGLLTFCKKHGWPLQTYSAKELAHAPGTFCGSDFVKKITGVDNVCERAAVLYSGGKLIREKTIGEGVTMAAAAKPCELDWSVEHVW